METERNNDDFDPKTPAMQLAKTAADAVERMSHGFEGAFSALLEELRPFCTPENSPKQTSTNTILEEEEKEEEASPKILKTCLQNLERNFQRGIVLIKEKMTEDQFYSALQLDKTAGTDWQTIQARLLANDSALLKQAATKLQGGGELIGIYANGELAIIDAADKNGNREPVITAFDNQGTRLTIKADTPNRKEIMQQISSGNGRFANYWEIRNAALEDGFTLPPDSPKLRKEGIIAAVQAITGKPFIHSKNDNEWCDAILDCGDEVTANSSSFIRTAYFSPTFETTGIDADSPINRRKNRGAIRILKG